MKKLIAYILLLITPLAFSNPYYTATGNPQPFARESSQVIANEFQLIQNGFSLIPNLATIPTYAVATGTANTYLVTLSTTPSSYTNGMVVNFYTSNPNTGASTLNVMGASGYLGPITILESTGGPLVTGDILSTAVVTVVYSGGYFYLTSGQSLPTQSANANKFLTTNGTSASWSLVPMASGVTGVLPAANGGTGASSITGIHYGNGSSPVTAATGSQILSLIGSSPVSTATNLNGGTAANQVPFQTGAGNTSYMTAPATNTMLYFDGTNFVWEPTATTLTNLGVKASGTDTAYAYRANNLSDLSNANTALNNILPSQSGKSGLFLQSNGTSTTWSAASGGSGLTSVGLSMPTAFTVSGSPLLSNGTLSVSYSGTAIPIANGGTGATTSSAALTALGGAPLASPNFSGTPQISGATIATSTNLAAYAPLASPTFSGSPKIGVYNITTTNDLASYATSASLSSYAPLSGAALSNPALTNETYTTNAAFIAGADSIGSVTLSSDNTIITTTSATAPAANGVTLPVITSSLVGRKLSVMVHATTGVNVYPQSGSTIDGYSAGTPLQIGNYGRAEFIATSTGSWISSSYSALTSQGFTSYYNGSDTAGQPGQISLITVNGATTGTKSIRVSTYGDSNGALEIINKAYSGAVMSINDTGNLSIAGTGYQPGGGSWSAPSDARLKDNQQPLTGALDKLNQLNPVTYTWKYSANEPSVGFIAQDVQKVIPNAVSVISPNDAQKPFIDDGKLLTIGWQNDMTAYMVGAIKELNALVNAQAAQINSQANDIATMKTRLGM
jgi:hypothetical protein